ncbi:uncharacterized protein LOC116262400 [Nymphaea colorata]|nr:uncharacterized protein LOC116262400 [Nymphaea colorata]
MALHVGASGRLTSPLLSPLPTPTTSNGVPPRTHTNLLGRTTTNFSFFPSKRWFNVRASTKEETWGSEPSKKSDASLLDHELLSLVSGAIDADQALRLIGEERRPESGGGTLSVSDCCAVLSAAIDHNNADLAISIFSAMRRSVDPAVLQSREMREMGSSVRIWRWPRPDVRTYACMILGLAACMRVSDAIQIISDLSRVGVLSGEEVPFGKVVRCPSCMIAIAVAQPQHGTQVAACSKCRYQYELFSGDIVSISSEAISTDIPAWEKGMRLLQILKSTIPAAVHSIVVCAPGGIARTQKFATKTAELPAQEGERVTVALSAPSYSSRGIGPFRLIPGIPGYNPGEPLSLFNHKTGVESQLLRAPEKSRVSSLVDPPVLFPLLALLATGDAASGIIDPALPKIIAVAAAGSFLLGTTVNMVVLPQLRKLPQRTVDAVAIKQQLFSQYDTLQARINELTQAAEKEVWMLARMCQLENKIIAVGETSYRARRSRVKKVRESLENSLRARIELIDSYARISSMIEIEVEMDSDVLAAEAANNAESIAEQIERIMELENLEQRWKEQAEANDELERLLNSQPLSTELV